MSRVLAGALVLLLCGAAYAEPKDDKPDSKSQGEHAPTADTHDQAGPKVTLESLKEQLTKMGYAPTVEGDFINITVNKDDYEVYLYFQADEDQLWMQSTLANEITNLDAVPSQAYWKLLDANSRIAPAHFILDPESKSLYITQSLSKSVVPNDVRKSQIEAFHKTIADTDALWREPFKGKEEKEAK